MNMDFPYNEVDDDIEIWPYGKATVEWDIYDYDSLSKKADTVYRSKKFNFSNAQWQFQLCPNGQRANASVTWISLYLVRISAAVNQRHSLCLNMSICSNNGTPYALSEGSYCFDETFNIFGWPHFIQTSELYKNWYRIAYPQGCLKLYCHITEDLPNINVASQTEPIDYGVDSLSEDFDRLLHSKQKSDVIIKVQNQVFHAHKLVLGARSSVFHAMFEHDMKENSSGIVNLDDCDPEVFQHFLTFMYTDKIEKLSPENASRLFALSDKYDVDRLKELCLNFMKNSLSVNIACEVMAVADRYDNKELRKSSKKLIIDNIKILISTEQWIVFMSEHPLLASEVLKTAIP